MLIRFGRAFNAYSALGLWYRVPFIQITSFGDLGPFPFLEPYENNLDTNSTSVIIFILLKKKVMMNDKGQATFSSLLLHHSRVFYLSSGHLSIKKEKPCYIYDCFAKTQLAGCNSHSNLRQLSQICTENCISVLHYHSTPSYFHGNLCQASHSM